MITCNLQGGLGNQLFQIYTTIAYAYDTNSRFFFPNIRELKNVITNRHTYWDTFLSNLKPFLLDPELINKDKNLANNQIFINNSNLSIKIMKINKKITCKIKEKS